MPVKNSRRSASKSARYNRSRKNRNYRKQNRNLKVIEVEAVAELTERKE